LVGTISIEKSELLSSMLKRKGIPHQVLNAKYHEKEAEIISHAGEKGMVTIATNMAGRGTDIKLGPGVVELGGLKIIGTERHESRRIDNQLRGRSGRQGDPGESRFYISLEDDLMRLFGSDKIKALVDKIGLEEDQPIENKMLSGAIENAQKKVEGSNLDIRKSLLQYDNVMNQQREVIYSQRRQVLEGVDLKDQIMAMIDDVISTVVDAHTGGGKEYEDYDIKGILRYCHDLFLPKGMLTEDQLTNISKEEIKEKLSDIAHKIYESKEEEFTSERMREIERVVLLRSVDTKWMDHIDAMDQLKQGIGLRAYRQRDPVQEYQFEGSAMFDEMIYNIKEETVKMMFHVKLERVPQRQRVAEPIATNEDNSVKRKPIVKPKKIGRNDPCPCGSGKKYKYCCGRN
ncbi:MAG TPA: preprotein translocase subunit SecA, partial [Clostridiaceae bacterium]|nr:preprotein translocase subunit SecA [Clostridiaceae bacterium]